MKIEELLAQIPPVLEYSLTVKKIGYRYFCYLIVNGGKSDSLNGSSTDLGVALQTISEGLKSHVTRSNQKSGKLSA